MTLCHTIVRSSKISLIMQLCLQVMVLVAQLVILDVIIHATILAGEHVQMNVVALARLVVHGNAQNCKVIQSNNNLL